MMTRQENSQSVPQQTAERTPKAPVKYWLLGVFALLFIGFLGSQIVAHLRADVGDVFSDYQHRISRLLNSEPISVALPLIAEQPRINQVRLPIPESSISLLNSQRLNRCRAGQLIANRNSSLGRVQPVQARVYYEISMISALSECLDDEQIQNSNLAPLLEQALTEKLDYLPLWINRFWTSEPAVRDTLRASGSARKITEQASSTEAIAALNYFSTLFDRLLTNPYREEIDHEQWMAQLQVLAQHQAVPTLLRTQQQTQGWLQALNQQLTRAGDILHCPQQQPPEAEYLQNVLHNVWIAELQPALAAWEIEFRQLQEAVQRITPQVQSEAWESYLNYWFDGNLAEQNQILTRAHAEQWQAFLSQCQLSVRPE